MADVRGRQGVVCDEMCGCPSPCSGAAGDCVCRGGGGSSDTNMEHKQCSCGEHCGCNPCTCSKSVTGTGKTFCKCGAGCTCATCAS